MKYEIRYIKPHEYPDGEISGGDAEWEAETNTKNKAFAIAKKVSKRTGVYETMVHEYANGSEDDFTHQWYFKGGIMTWDMGSAN